ncbi:MAG: nuclear transport factor 2 family protein [Hyphomonas sp.]
MYTEIETEALKVVEKLQQGWETLDRDLILSAFHEDAVMQSMMKAPYQGKPEIAAMLDGFLAIATSVRMQVLNRCVDGNVVTLERRDHFTVHGKSGVLPAVGIFEIEDGLVRTWREYFDWAFYERQLED